MVDVGIDIEIQGGACVGVAQYFLNALGACSACQKQRGTGVAKVVGGEIGKVVPLHKAFQILRDGIGHPRFKQTMCGREHESRCQVRVRVLPLREFLILLERVKNARNHGNSSYAMDGFRCADLYS